MNLSQVLNREQKKEEGQFPFPLQSFRGEEMTVSSPLFLSIENIGKGKARILGNAKLVLKTSCDRCLVPMEYELLLDFEREVYGPDYVDEEIREEQLFMDGNELDIEALVTEELNLSWPSKLLCSEDCKGICRKCGQNLNMGSCDCDDFVPDIRFANLMDIFEGKKS